MTTTTLKRFLLIVLLIFCQLATSAQTFELIPLGVHGGGEENNLSAYLLGEKGEHNYISLDAGTLRSGIDRAIENGVFRVSNTTVLQNYIKGYFISHGHLDHLSGMVINAPDDSAKNIYALPFTIDILKNHYFTNTTWSNFADKGEKPRLGTYTYQPVKNGQQFSVKGTNLTGRIFELSHGNPYKSSAVLIRNKQDRYVLYLGDTGADRIEKSRDLERLWTYAAPLIKDNRLKAILIETSFPDSQPEDKLFGHLTPKLLQEELQVLAQKTGRKKLTDLKIIVTHLKPGHHRIVKIKEELRSHNPLDVHFVFPAQGERIFL